MWSSRYLVFVFIGFSFRGLAQDSTLVNDLAPKVELESVTEKRPFFSSVSIVFDYGKLAGLFLTSESKFEVGAEIAFFNKFLIIGELGKGTLKPKDAYKNTNYTSEGRYYRAGLGYKIDINENNNFSISARYARSKYSDYGLIDVENTSLLYKKFSQSFIRDDLSAYWYELVISSESRIWKGLYLGFHARLRVMGDYDEQQPLDVFSIPGYGRTFDKSIPAFNLYVKYSLERFNK